MKLQMLLYLQLDGVIDRKRIIMSCGGGMPPNVSTENIKAFVKAVQECS